MTYRRNMKYRGIQDRVGIWNVVGRRCRGNIGWTTGSDVVGIWEVINWEAWRGWTGGVLVKHEQSGPEITSNLRHCRNPIHS